MDEVEAAAMLDGVSHHFVVGVKFRSERGDQRRDVLAPHVRNDVHVQCGAHDAVQ
ncbi:MAG: hypothetical protein NTV69_07355 [Caldilinea sp.]|nr:hypothetical protein [Caldilinea sp.]